MICLKCHKHPPVQVKKEKLLFDFIRASFNQRRKTLVNGLSHFPGISLSKEQIQEQIQMLGLPATVRGESLTLAQFAALSDAIYSSMDFNG